MVQVHFISAVCENMISGRGMRPGDIVTASNGITIEVSPPPPARTPQTPVPS